MDSSHNIPATAAPNPATPSDPRQWHVQLLDMLQRALSEEDTRVLCFELSLDYDDLAGSSRIERTVSLLEYCIRKNQVGRLLQRCGELHATMDWASIGENARKFPMSLETDQSPKPPVHLFDKAPPVLPNPVWRKPAAIFGAIAAGLAVIGAITWATLRPPATPPVTPRPSAAPIARNVVQELRTRNIFGGVLSAAESLGQLEMLGAPGSITVFAPTDASLQNVAPSRLQALRGDAIHLKCHIVVGTITAPTPGQSIDVVSMGGCKINFRNEGGTLKVNDANAAGGWQTNNGHVYPIDRLLSPPVSP